jgi:hypothetical protein
VRGQHFKASTTLWLKAAGHRDLVQSTRDRAAAERPRSGITRPQIVDVGGDKAARTESGC